MTPNSKPSGVNGVRRQELRRKGANLLTRRLHIPKTTIRTYVLHRGVDSQAGELRELSMMILVEIFLKFYFTPSWASH